MKKDKSLRKLCTMCRENTTAPKSQSQCMPFDAGIPSCIDTQQQKMDELQPLMKSGLDTARSPSDEVWVATEVRSFVEAVNLLETKAKAANVKGIPEAPSFMLDGTIPLGTQATFELLTLLDERFQAVNDRILDAEEVGSPPSQVNVPVRKIGRFAHLIYEESKPLFWSFGIARLHSHYVELLTHATQNGEANPHLRRWLAMRGMTSKSSTA